MIFSSPLKNQRMEGMELERVERERRIAEARAREEDARRRQAFAIVAKAQDQARAASAKVDSVAGDVAELSMNPIVDTMPDFQQEYGFTGRIWFHSTGHWWERFDVSGKEWIVIEVVGDGVRQARATNSHPPSTLPPTQEWWHVATTIGDIHSYL